MTTRPSAAYGLQAYIDDIQSVLTYVELCPGDASVAVVCAEDGPWGSGWDNILLAAGGRTILIPVFDGWPLPSGSSILPEDLEQIDPTDLLPALRSILYEVRNVGDLDSSFKIGIASLQRIAAQGLSHLSVTRPDLLNKVNPGDGMILCEVGMDDEGTPTFMVEAPDDLYHVPLSDALRQAIIDKEPLLLIAYTRADFVIESRGSPTVILGPQNNSEQGTSLEARLPSPVEILRHLKEYGSDK